MTRATILGLLVIAAGTALGCSVDSRLLRVAAPDASSDDASPDEDTEPTDARRVGPDGAVACRPPNTRAIFGSPGSPASTAGSFAYAAPGLTAPILTAAPTFAPIPTAFQVTANPGVSNDPNNAWAGVGFVFLNPACVDARAYSGITFTLTGDLGTCIVTFTATTANDVPAGPSGLGACTGSSCMSPGTGAIGIGTTVMRFADLHNGQPMPELDTSALLGLLWGVSVPADPNIAPCQASFTISDVSFVSD